VEILYLLVPMSVVLALLVLALFAWALNAGQFEPDDLDAEGERILLDEVPAPRPGFDADQAPAAMAPEQSPGLPLRAPR
jgi:cbb3-type cytochrome oxidase maturation protein